MPAVVTLTLNPAVDVFSSADLVEPEHKIRCSLPQRDPGGGGVNVARAIRALGGESLAVYPAGGPTGVLLDRLLDAEGLPRISVPSGGLTRESFTVLETATGREFRFVLQGSGLDRSEWERCLRAIEELQPAPEYLVGSGSLPEGVPPDFYARLAASARARGARFVLDTSGEPLRLALEEGVFLAKPNRRELEELTGQRIEEPEEQLEAARSLLAAGVEVVALTLGADGALLVTSEGSRRTRPPAVKTRSSVGAGDSFVGGMVLGLLRGMPIDAAFCLGVSAGTAALLNPGTGLCCKEDTERLYADLCAGGA